jgi:hypothetical protein
MLTPRENSEKAAYVANAAFFKKIRRITSISIIEQEGISRNGRKQQLVFGKYHCATKFHSTTQFFIFRTGYVIVEFFTYLLELLSRTMVLPFVGGKFVVLCLSSSKARQCF